MSLRMTPEQVARHRQRIGADDYRAEAGKPAERAVEPAFGVKFFVPGEPQGKKSPVAVSVMGSTRILKAAKTRAYERFIATFAAAAMNGRSPIDVPVSLYVQMVMGVPVSWSKVNRQKALDGRIKPTRKPDVSNCIKSCEDAMTGIVWRDDALVVDLWASKRYGLAPGVRVSVALADRPVEIRWLEAA